MVRYIYACLILIFTLAVPFNAAADAVMKPLANDYPQKLLHHRMTRIVVIIRGTLAETIVYSEFVNEWDKPTGGVYSFPLPADASATGLWFEWKDAYHEAILKEVPQVTNPGTGEGGFAALLNNYLGGNAVNMKIDTILPGAIQRIQLRYLQRIRYENGMCTYRFPLSMETIETTPVDICQMTIQIHNSPQIQGVVSPSHPSGWQITDSLGSYFTMAYEKNKEYLQKDLIIHYVLPTSGFSIKSMSAMDSDSSGYFCSMEYPSSANTSFQKQVVFLIDNSTSMRGFKLQQSCEAIKSCIAAMNAPDQYAIVTFDNSIQTLVSVCPATTANQIMSFSKLDTLARNGGTVNGSNLFSGLVSSLSLCNNTTYSNMILVLTDGFSACTPEQVVNSNRVGIFTIGIGNEISRDRCELIAFANGGNAAFISEKDSVCAEIVSVFNQVRKPIIKNITLVCEGGGINSLLPQTNNFSLFEGAAFFITGRYRQPASAQFGIQGTGTDGTVKSAVFAMPLSADSMSIDKEYLKHTWAAEELHRLERQIIVYNKYTDLRPQAVATSLAYKVKCKFTSYWPDYDKTYNGDLPGAVPVIEKKSAEDKAPAFNVSFDRTRRALFVSFMLQKKTGTISLRIFNAQGRLIVESLDNSDRTGRITLSCMVPRYCAAGLYFVAISFGNESVVRPFTIPRQ